MPNPRLASRYAKSLIDLAVEQDQLEQVYSDMLFLQKVISANREFAILLRSPIVSPDKKVRIIDAVTAGKISSITAAFTRLIVTKGREANLSEMISAFIQQYKNVKQIHTVHLTTAAAVSEEVKTAIVNQIKSTSNLEHIELHTKVDESLIGGFVLQAGDKLVDASISYDLKEISRQFENNDFIYSVR
ncbi:MAG TPA: ATP synthase F1 subunit delta [Chitinophagaceae bacterium]|jgi:F-type H+-transporting ATPase subunit delta|nr:ATP synthase F1 subunit delta [Chitinophagaceae bacterium]